MDKKYHWAVIAVVPADSMDRDQFFVSLAPTYTAAKQRIPSHLDKFRTIGTTYYVCQIIEKSAVTISPVDFTPRDEANYTREEREAMEKYYTLHDKDLNKDEDPF